MFLTSFQNHSHSLDGKGVLLLAGGGRLRGGVPLCLVDRVVDGGPSSVHSLLTLLLCTLDSLCSRILGLLCGSRVGLAEEAGHKDADKEVHAADREKAEPGHVPHNLFSVAGRAIEALVVSPGLVVCGSTVLSLGVGRGGRMQKTNTIRGNRDWGF